jgi:hypothetical protein
MKEIKIKSKEKTKVKVNEPIDKVKIITVCNSGYLDFTINWFESIRRVNLESITCVYCTDDRSYTKLKELNINCVRWKSKRFKADEDFIKFRREGWSGLVYQKLEIVRSLLKKGYHVLFSDSDIVFNIDPISYLKEYIKENDIIIQKEFSKRKKARKINEFRFPYTLCSGFFFVKPTEKSLDLFDMDKKDIHDFICDQELVNVRIWNNKEGLAWTCLPVELFPNGKFWYSRHEQIKNSCYIVHYNYTLGYAKKLAKMVDFGHWFSDEEIINTNKILNTREILRQKVPFEYSGHKGPWIEDYFYKYWRSHKDESKTDRIYVPVFWTDLFVKYGGSRRIKRKRQSVLNRLNPENKYFTVVQLDSGIRDNVPSNLLTFAAGGKGNIPIPLLKGDRQFSNNPNKDILVSFASRDEIGEKRDILNKVKNSKASYHIGDSWEDIMSRSIFSLCPRGHGRTSFRMYEALSMGSIPVYLWTDKEWLPYKDEINWNDIIVSLNLKDIGNLENVIKKYSKEDIQRMQDKIKIVYNKYFNYESICENILKVLSQEDKK